jgi:hypothetical protein
MYRATRTGRYTGRRHQQRNLRKAGNTRGLNKQLGVQLQTTLTTGPSDPDQTSPDMIMRKKSLLLLVTDTVAQGRFQATLTPRILAGTIAEGELPTRFRILKLSVFGSESIASNITLGDFTSDRAVFNDTGVEGNSRPVIHILPSLQVSQTWYNNNSDTTIYAMSAGVTGPDTTPTSYTFYVQATLEVRLQGPVMPLTQQ